jgi:hypothetical protein
MLTEGHMVPDGAPGKLYLRQFVHVRFCRHCNVHNE